MASPPPRKPIKAGYLDATGRGGEEEEEDPIMSDSDEGNDALLSLSREFSRLYWSAVGSDDDDDDERPGVV